MVQPPELSLLSLLSATPDSSQKPALPGTELFGNVLAHLQTLTTTAATAAGGQELLPAAAAIRRVLQQASLLHTAALEGEVNAAGLPPTRPRQEEPEQQALDSILQALQDILATLSLPVTPLPTPASNGTPVPTEATASAVLPSGAPVPVALSSRALPQVQSGPAGPAPSGQQTVIIPAGQADQGTNAAFDMEGSGAPRQPEAVLPETRPTTRMGAFSATPQHAVSGVERQGGTPVSSRSPDDVATTAPTGQPALMPVTEPEMLPGRFTVPAGMAPQVPGRSQMGHTAPSPVERRISSPVRQSLAVQGEGDATAEAAEALDGAANSRLRTVVTPDGGGSGIPTSGPTGPVAETHEQTAILHGVAQRERRIPADGMTTPPAAPHRRAEAVSEPAGLAGARGAIAPGSVRPLVTTLGEGTSAPASLTGLPHQTEALPGGNTQESVGNALGRSEASTLTGGIAAPAVEPPAGRLPRSGQNASGPRLRTETPGQAAPAPGGHSARLTGDTPELSAAPEATTEPLGSDREAAALPQPVAMPRVSSPESAGDAPDVSMAAPRQDRAVSGVSGQRETQVPPVLQSDAPLELSPADALPSSVASAEQVAAGTQQESSVPQTTMPMSEPITPSVPAAQVISADAPMPAAGATVSAGQGDTTGVSLDGSTIASTASGPRSVLAGSDARLPQAAAESLHPAPADTASAPIETLSSAAGEQPSEDQPEGQKDTAFRSNQSALSGTDHPGVTGTHLAEGVGQAGQTEAVPKNFSPEAVEQATPRAVPLSPEHAARVLGRPLPHGTVVLQLNPPELGYMQVQVQLTDGHLSAAFWADSPEVRTLLQTHFPTLQQNLSGHGFPEYQISTTLSGGEFTGQAGQFAHQQASSQFFGQGRDRETHPGRVIAFPPNGRPIAAQRATVWSM